MNIQSETIAFDDGPTRLAGTLARPVSPGPVPALAFAHGSGPMNRDLDGRFVPIRSHFASHGYAILSYDKPGVGESTGDWHDQSFDDRARESVAAVRWLQSRPGIDPARVGLIGGSQAGWVMPLAYALANDLAFIISVSGSAVPVWWQEQYRLEQQLRVDGYPEEQIAAALRLHRSLVDGVRQGRPAAEIAAGLEKQRDAPWMRYFAGVGEADVRFFALICDFDPVAALRQVRCPFLGIWGELDTYVPVAESMRRTREALEGAGNARFELKLFPRANHGLRLAQTGSPSERTTEYAPGYLDSMTDWLAAVLDRMNDIRSD